MSFIKLDRKICDWEWFTDANTLKVWIYLLVNAKYKDTEYRGTIIKRGQLLIGRKRLADDLEMTEQQVRTCLSRLERTKEISIKSTNKNSLISIVKYGFYQGEDEISNQLATSKQPANNQQTTTYKRNIRKKEGKNIFNSIPTYDTSMNPVFTDEEEDDLLERMGKSVH